MLRKRFRLALAIIALGLSFLIVAGPGVRARPELAEATNCTYLPLVVGSGEGSGTPLAGVAEAVTCLPAAAPNPTATATMGPTPTATATTPAPAELTGALGLLPEQAEIASPGAPVRRYLVVLDASGSMSAGFNGQCNNTGVVVQCANGPPGAPAVQVAGTGVNYWWQTESERRIYVAKKALERLVQRSNMPGNAGYDGSRPSDQVAVVWFNEAVPAGNALAFSSDPTTIVDFITDANRTNGDAYRSQGGTNGAAGLYRAALLLQAAPSTVDFNGQTYSYDTHVIFITDGVSNQFLDVTAVNLWGGQSQENTYPNGSYCRLLGPVVSENAECQTTEVGGMYNGWDRPITQMVRVSQDYLKSGLYGPADVYVVALSNLPNIGLREGVASGVDYFFAAEALETFPDGLTNVDKIIEIISSPSEPPGASCQPIVAADWVDQIDAAHLPEGVAGLGEVTLTSLESGAVYRASIGADPATGQLRYRFGGLPAGNYLLQAYLFYKGDDGVTRTYGRIVFGDSLVDELTVSLAGQTHILDLRLRLSGDVCAV